MTDVANGTTANGHTNGVNGINGVNGTNGTAKEASATAIEVTHHETQQSKSKDSSTLGIRCGPVGERLVVHVVDELAEDTPERVYASVTKSMFDIEQGFCDITFEELTGAVNTTSWSISEQVGTSADFGVIAYLGVSDVRYAVYLYAAIKTGHQLMIPSVRNSQQQHLAVFTEANCRIVYYTPEMAAVVAQIKEAMPDLKAFEVPPLDDLLATSNTAKHFPYTLPRHWPVSFNGCRIFTRRRLLCPWPGLAADAGADEDAVTGSGTAPQRGYR